METGGVGEGGGPIWVDSVHLKKTNHLNFPELPIEVPTYSQHCHSNRSKTHCQVEMEPECVID